MYTVKIIRLLIILVVVTSCSENVQIKKGGDYDRITRKYSSNRISWEIQIPENWELTHIDTIKSQAQRGLDRMEMEKFIDDIEPEIKSQYLIGFLKNKRNSFSAFIDEKRFNKSDFQKVNRNSKIQLLN